jgi:hypothetical protein
MRDGGAASDPVEGNTTGANMTNPISKLVLAAALASSIPAAASANDRDRDCDHDRAPPVAAYGRVAYPAAPPAAYLAYPEPPRPAPRQWREARWRERELAEVSAQLRALDAERDRFYAENGWRPGRVRRYERWYAARRAELERRWYELQTVAWR